jgi:hypothetical protein
MPSRPLFAGVALVAAASLAVLVLGGGRGEGARRA